MKKAIKNLKNLRPLKVKELKKIHGGATKDYDKCCYKGENPPYDPFSGYEAYYICD